MVVRALVLWDNSGFSKISFAFTDGTLDKILSISLKMLILCEALIKLMVCIKSVFAIVIGLS